MDFTATGETDKTVVLKTRSSFWVWGWLGRSDRYSWDIGLDRDIPLYLTVDSGSGDKVLDLSGLRLAGLDCALGSGDMRVMLPVTAQPVSVSLDVSSGDMSVDSSVGAKADISLDLSSGSTGIVLGADSDVTVRVRVSSGKATVTVPAASATRVEVDKVSSGSVEVPSGLERTSGGGGDEGTWESPGAGDAANAVDIIVEDVSSGTVVIRQGG